MMLYIKAERLPKDAKPGDLLEAENGNFELLKEETVKRKAKISALLDEIITKKD